MTKYRPLKKGSRVQRTSDSKKGVIRTLLPSGSALVRFQDGSEHPVFLALLKRIPKPPSSGRKKRVPIDPPAVKVESHFQSVVASRMQALSYTHETLAVRAGLSRVTLYRLLSGEYRSFRVATLEAIAAALGVSPRDFWSPAREGSDGEVVSETTEVDMRTHTLDNAPVG